MKLSRILANILNGRLIDRYGYNTESNDGNYTEYIDNLIVDPDSYESHNEMLSELTDNYKLLVIA